MAAEMPTERASRERQELIQQAASLNLKITQVQKSLVISKTQLERQKKITRVLGVFGAILLAISVTLIVIFIRTRTYSLCVSNWADQYTKRQDAITALGQIRTDKLDDLVRTLDLPKQKQLAAFERALHSYLEASDAYRAYTASHPLPTSPKLHC